MTDKDTENFEEEFSLAEEAEFEERPPVATRSEPPLIVRLIVTIAVLCLIGYGLYKGVVFFKQRIKNVVPQVTAWIMPNKKTSPIVPSTTNQATTGNSPKAESGESFEEISKAFSKADQTGTSNHTPLDANKASDASTISNLQKDLFNGHTTDATSSVNLITASKEQAEKLQAQEAKQTVLQSTLDRVNNQLENNNQQIKRIETALNTLGRPLSQISREVKSLDGRIQTITDSLNTLAEDLNSLKKGLINEGFELPNVPDAPLIGDKAKQHKSTHPATLPAYTGPEYSIHAIVPGRAWLKSQKGQIITVTEGDSLGDYGKVLVIDAVNSTLMTSSGISFK